MPFEQLSTGPSGNSTQFGVPGFTIGKKGKLLHLNVQAYEVLERPQYVSFGIQRKSQSDPGVEIFDFGIRAEAGPGLNIVKVSTTHTVSSSGVLNAIRGSVEDFVGSYKAEFDGEYLYAELRRRVSRD